MMATGVVELKQDVKTETGRLEIVRVIKASRQRVFDAWTRPEMIRQWFGPAISTKAPEVAADARVDGEYGITMHGSPAPEIPERTIRVKGRYTRVEPYDALAFTWDAEFAPGEVCLVTITLKDVEGGTEMRLVQEGFTQDATRDGHLSGWTVGLDKMQRLLECA
jgi:uncharacterized protein YndB with AHSA1/START domain